MGGERGGDGLRLQCVSESTAVCLREPDVRTAAREAIEARQRFVTDRAAGAQIHDRLVHDRDGVWVLEHVLDLRALLVVAREPWCATPVRAVRPLQSRVVELGAALAVALGFVHGEVCLAQELLDPAVVRATDDQPDAGRDRDGLAVEFDRLREGLEDPRGGMGHAGGVGDVLDEHAELVAAQARRGVGRAQAGAESARDLFEQSVAVRVAASVVGSLEIVEVGE